MENDVDKESEKEINLTGIGEWTACKIYVDSRVSGSDDGYIKINSRLNIGNKISCSPFDHFFFFLINIFT